MTLRKWKLTKRPDGQYRLDVVRGESCEPLADSLTCTELEGLVRTLCAGLSLIPSPPSLSGYPGLSND